MKGKSEALATSFADAYLLAGSRTPFSDYNGALAPRSRANSSVRTCAMVSRPPAPGVARA
jgi:hypothetical protein